MTTTLVGIFDPRDIVKKEPGLFAITSCMGEEYFTYNRILTREIARFFPGRSRSEKISIAKQLLCQTREKEQEQVSSQQPIERVPFILEISNSIAREVEAYKLPDKQTRLAIRKRVVEEWLQSFEEKNKK